MRRDSIDLGKTGVSLLFRLYFIPTLFGMLSICVVTAVDGIFVGRGVGSDALAAVNIGIAPTMVMMGITLLLGVGVSVISSINRDLCELWHRRPDGLVLSHVFCSYALADKAQC